MQLKVKAALHDINLAETREAAYQAFYTQLDDLPNRLKKR